MRGIQYAGQAPDDDSLLFVLRRLLYFAPRGPTSISTHPAPPKYSTARKEHLMSFHDTAVPAYLQILGSLTGILTKAEAHCAAKNIAPEVLLGARLYPDMLPLQQADPARSAILPAKGCAR